MATINGYWAKTRYGYLAHFWLDYYRTLCGQTHMTPRPPRLAITPARSTCKRCQKRYNALLAAQEKGATG